jgi:hypothetical protein
VSTDWSEIASQAAAIRQDLEADVRAAERLHAASVRVFDEAYLEWAAAVDSAERAHARMTAARGDCHRGRVSVLKLRQRLEDEQQLAGVLKKLVQANTPAPSGGTSDGH